MKKTLKTSSIVLGLVLVLALTILDLYLHNFRTVIPNQVYRSRQLSKAQFAKVIPEYHIRSILNLRGANPGALWYSNELTISKKDHVKHFNLPLSSQILPDTQNFRELVHILMTAPRPILIHCESGVDRSGLASAVSLILANQPLNKVAEQVSWKYFVIEPESTGKQFLRSYEAWLVKNKLATSKTNFLKWLNQYR